MEKVKKFLQFNGKNIYFVDKNGEYFIAIKPICEALGIQFIAQFKRLKDDKILGQLLSKQTMVGADFRLRNMVALPEKYIYGWLFSVNSDVQLFKEYKMKCYDVLYDYFKGSLTKRHEQLIEKTSTEIEIETLKDKLSPNEDYRKLCDLEIKRSHINRQLKNLDQELLEKQLTIELS